MAIIEPGCVSTPIWGKGSLPNDPSPYQKSLERLGRFFEFGLRRPAMPEDVADDTWMEANCLQGEAFYGRWEELVGVDYYRD